ncbi:DUF5107 domain-containing protein [Maribacter sp. SA7]|uniref:DUF5107 domain-containing protein n=1 Tax=Maribacter zhoushanensis TaxID=3030012 RepID=UPI0023EC9518|nr:DUF5107 domain-containing protein [Maribacter zhoushanensis]MDF4203254.1 DUF5107 domain-containing protein [Maribacter zhoushanensis]
MRTQIQIILVLLISGLYSSTTAQSISIKEEILSLETYGFSEPNPVPISAENPKIIPYFKFERYEHTSKKQEWKVVTLENDYIKVQILPEIGGKIWGAIEKSTGEEFLYKNEVIKFRNIAMRGPWTSGGIEFNFGIIGHHPSTATPVDYITKTNLDGSVSCIVSNIDLPSNTKWTVEIKLEKDKAYFETNAYWYNASPLTTSYYNWMTGAAKASNDLEFFIPGNKHLEHNGNSHSWPIDKEKHNLAMYNENKFGSSKSYHIVGEFDDFFGGYYHDTEFGFGHWSLYEEMPGQKLWLWALSRSGGIWEDLLTDTDGQYIEFQAGRLFDQYQPTNAVNPISQVGFDPYMMDKWSEIWFPFKQIGGMVDASPEGVLNVETVDGETYIKVNALQNLDTKIQIFNGQETIIETLNLKPMEIYSKKIVTTTPANVEVSVLGTELEYKPINKPKDLKRPFFSDKDLNVSETEKLLFAGIEAIEYREYKKAEEHLKNLLNIDPSHSVALTKLAELEYRKSNYNDALTYANTVLRMDTYNASANYMAGIAYRANNDTVNALESLGWAARDIKFRSVSYAQIAELYLANKQLTRAETYAQKALDFNTYNVNAREVLLLAANAKNDSKALGKTKEDLIHIDPLNYLIALENKSSNTIVNDLNIQNEFKEESFLTIALRYKELGFDQKAIEALSMSKETVKNQLWLAFLKKITSPHESEVLLNSAINKQVDFVFPYRRETIPVLNWASAKNDNWKLRYYLAQNYIAVGLKSKGITILEKLKNTPNSPIFYQFRAKLLQSKLDENSKKLAITDLQRALDLQPNNWKIWEENILLYQNIGDFEKAYNLSKKATKKFPENYNIALAHAKSLLSLEEYSEVAIILENINVLPFELANESRKIYEKTYQALALNAILKKNYIEAKAILEKAKQWPENIGVGKPYSPDERITDYLLAITLNKLNETVKSKALLNSAVTYTKSHYTRNTTNHLAGLLAAKQLHLNKKELENLLNKTDGVLSKIAIAIFNNDTDAVDILRAQKNISELELEQLRLLSKL